MIIHAAWHFYHFQGSAYHTRLQSNGDNDRPQTTSDAQQNAIEYDMSSFSPEQLPPTDKHLEAEMQPVIN